jgi:hypothetical protein
MVIILNASTDRESPNPNPNVADRPNGWMKWVLNRFAWEEPKVRPALALSPFRREQRNPPANPGTAQKNRSVRSGFFGCNNKHFFRKIMTGLNSHNGHLNAKHRGYGRT